MSKIIYLDQNKWIDIARAFYGKSEGDKYKTVLKLLQEKVLSGEIILPISTIHIIETSRKADKESRQRLSEFIAPMTKSFGILPNFMIRDQEVENAIMQKIGKDPINNISEIVIKKGIYQMLGLEFEKDSIIEIFNQFTLNNEISDKVIAKIMIDLIDRELLDEIREEDEKAAKEYEIKRKQNQESLSKEMRLRLAISEMMNTAFLHKIIEQLNNHGIEIKQFSDLLLNADDWKNFIFSMPSIDIWINLHVLRDSNKDKSVHRNDSADIAFLSVAVPYCDVVVTEKYWTHLLVSNRFDKKYNTIVLSDINALIQYI